MITGEWPRRWRSSYTLTQPPSRDCTEKPSLYLNVQCTKPLFMKVVSGLMSYSLYHATIFRAQESAGKDVFDDRAGVSMLQVRVDCARVRSVRLAA